MSPKPQPGIMNIAAYVGGKSSVGGNVDVLKLSSNEGALGPSPKAIERLSSMSAWHRYPDGGALEVREALAERYNLPVDRIVCGAGSDEIIALLIQAYAGVDDEVLHSEHGFSMYAISAKANGAVPVAAPETQLCTNVDTMLAAVTPRTKLVFVANPNNPTGSYLPKTEIDRLHNGLPEDVILVIDGAYSEYVVEPDYDDCLQRALNSKNMVVTRTFSKLYALGGLRLGWMVGPTDIVDVMNRVRGPFNVSSAAIAAGAEAVRDQAFEEQSRQLNNEQMDRVVGAVRQLGIHTHPSVGNFFLLDFGKAETAREADNFLQSQGIIVRQVAGYGLPTCLRLTLGTHEQMSRVLDALASFMEGRS